MVLYFRVENRVMNKKKNKLLYIWSKPIFYSIIKWEIEYHLSISYSKLYFRVKNRVGLEML